MAPEAEGVVSLGVDEGVFVAGVDDVDPVAAFVLGAGIVFHFDEAVRIGVERKNVVEGFFAGGFVGGEPGEVAIDVEEGGDVDDEIGLGVEQKAPLAFVETVLVEGAAGGVAGVVIEAGLHAAIGLQRVIAVVVEGVAVGRKVFGIVDEDPQVGDVLLVQADVAGVKIVAAHEIAINDADAGDGVGDGGESLGVGESEVPAVIKVTEVSRKVMWLVRTIGP